MAQNAAYLNLAEGLDGSPGYYQLHQKDLKTLIQRLALLPPSAWWEESADFRVLE